MEVELQRESCSSRPRDIIASGQDLEKLVSIARMGRICGKKGLTKQLSRDMQMSSS